MSQQDTRGAPASATIARRVPVALAAVTVLAQVAYPLTPPGPARHQLTVVTVVLFFTASVSHALVWRGGRFAAALVAVTAGGGLAIEAVGAATGVPFGAYDYTATLGWLAFGVPVVIPLAWTMMGYPALVIGWRLAGDTPWWPVVAGWALASWDLFLDPQMIDAGHWRWGHGDAPVLQGVPVTNYLAWFVVGTAMMALLGRLIQPQDGPAVAADDRLPYALYLWTYASSVLAHAAFFDLPSSALTGAVGMGVVAVPLAAALWHGRSRR